jgi:hypothetical protein
MPWLLNFAVEIVAASAVISVISAGIGIWMGFKDNEVKIKLNGKRLTFSHLDQEQVRKIVAELTAQQEKDRPRHGGAV